MKSKLACDKNLFMQANGNRTIRFKEKEKEKEKSGNFTLECHTNLLNEPFEILTRIEAKAMLKENGFFQAIGISKQKFTFFSNWKSIETFDGIGFFFGWYSGVYFTFYFSRVFSFFLLLLLLMTLDLHLIEFYWFNRYFSTYSIVCVVCIPVYLELFGLLLDPFSVLHLA